MTKQLYFLTMLALVAVVLAACNKEREPCLTLKTAQLNINTVQFRDTSRNATDTALRSAVFGALTDRGVQAVRYLSASANFTISLSPGSDTCTWLIATDTTATYDTLQFYYARNLKFISNACGYTYFYSVSAVTTTHNSIDSVIITDPAVTNNVNSKNLRIFIRRGI
jgi:hypothetical protein